MTDEFAKKLIGLPVYIEHDERHQIGNVVDAFVNEKRQIKALLHIHGNVKVNELLPSTLYKDPLNDSRGYYNSLSLGNSVGLVKNGNSVSVSENTPSEISICMDGDRPMTEIDDYWFVPKGTDVKAFIKEKIYTKINKY
jgi:hypothetical protein